MIIKGIMFPSVNQRSRRWIERYWPLAGCMEHQGVDLWTKILSYQGCWRPGK